MVEYHSGTTGLYRVRHSALVTSLARRFLRIRTSRLERLVFTATTGRSGTLTLTRLFSLVPDCASFHEPYPIMNGLVLKAASYGEDALVDRIYHRAKTIRILRSAVGYRYYMEANHLFVKTFIRQAIEDFGDRIAVVHLVRSPVEVAQSIFSLQSLPGTEEGNIWWLDYHAPTNIIRIAELLDADPEFSHPFYRCLWYWYEVELRFAGWRTQFPSLRVVRFETPWFNDKGKVFRLLDDLGIEFDPSRIEPIVGRREHIRTDEKVVDPLPPAEAERMHVRFRQLLADRGLGLPAAGSP
ncbi:MAG: hypothetical protein WCP29_12120 [Acidobacteriota bacterium]